MTHTLRAVLIAGALVVAPAAAVVTPAAAARAAPAGTQAISISGLAFSPSSVTVAQGTVTTWTNNDAVMHSVTSDSSDTTDPFDSSPTNCPSPGSGCIQPGGTFSHTFNVLGTFSYHCRVHSFMHGSVTVAAPSVTLTALSPNALGQGAAKMVTFTGTGFASGATVSFSGTSVTAGPTTFVSSTSLKATVRVAASAATGRRDVTVTNSGGGGSGTCTGCLTIDARPGVTSASPSMLARGSTNVTVMVTGTGFAANAKAKFSGAGVAVTTTTFVSSTQLQLKVTVAANGTTGFRTLTVTNPDGGMGTKVHAVTIT
jgi:plastocyanin